MLNSLILYFKNCDLIKSHPLTSRDATYKKKLKSITRETFSKTTKNFYYKHKIMALLLLRTYVKFCINNFISVFHD